MTTTTGAELQTFREACGLDRAALGELCGVEARTVKHWETRPGAGIPADVFERVERLAHLVRTVAAHGLGQAKKMAHHCEAVKMQAISEKEPRLIGARDLPEIVLIRYREIDNMFPMDAMSFEHAAVHGAAITRLAMDLTAKGFTPRVVWFDPASFTSWREALRWTTDGQPAEPPTDNTETRAAWAASAGLAEQIKPYRADQPPPSAAR